MSENVKGRRMFAPSRSAMVALNMSIPYESYQMEENNGREQNAWVKLHQHSIDQGIFLPYAPVRCTGTFFQVKNKIIFNV